jgi:hypothetical protein
LLNTLPKLVRLDREIQIAYVVSVFNKELDRMVKPCYN